jgi:hypothetical protein
VLLHSRDRSLILLAGGIAANRRLTVDLYEVSKQCAEEVQVVDSKGWCSVFVYATGWLWPQGAHALYQAPCRCRLRGPARRRNTPPHKPLLRGRSALLPRGTFSATRLPRSTCAPDVACGYDSFVTFEFAYKPSSQPSICLFTTLIYPNVTAEVCILDGSVHCGNGLVLFECFFGKVKRGMPAGRIDFNCVII